MTINKAIEHFKYKLTNVWKATEHDITAFNKLVDFVNVKHKQQLRQNELFAKLYVFAYAYYIKRYDSDVYCKTTQKELHKLLDLPLELFMQRFTRKINDIEMEQMYKSKKLDIKHTKQYTAEENEIIKDILLNHEEWTVEDMQEQMYAQINNVLNEFHE